jgi:purine-nucleoside phosphorylase
MNIPIPQGGGFPALAEAARACPPKIAVVLGSGMSGLSSRLQVEQTISFLDVPDFAAPSVPGHAGQLLLGTWAGKRALVFSGRLHYYEGLSWREVTAPVRTAAFLGARLLLATNAAGGIHDRLEAGHVLVVRDHIDWIRPAPWKAPGPGSLGGQGPSPYSARLVRLLVEAGQGLGIPLHVGVYAACSGPSYETPAEIRALSLWGADAVGMSTACEVQTAADLGLECAAISCIANRAAGLAPGRLCHEEVVQAAAAASEQFRDLVQAFLESL